jgi:hypothetical protein
MTAAVMPVHPSAETVENTGELTEAIIAWLRAEEAIIIVIEQLTVGTGAGNCCLLLHLETSAASTDINNRLRHI